MASLIPVRDEPLLRWRQREREVDGPWGMASGSMPSIPAFWTSSSTPSVTSGPARRARSSGRSRLPGADVSGWWEWSITKIACEHLFMVGAIGVTHRRGFERVFDLTERVLPPG